MRLALQRFFSRVSVKFADFPMPNDFTTKLDSCMQSVSDDAIALFQVNSSIYLVVYYMTILLRVVRIPLINFPRSVRDESFATATTAVHLLQKQHHELFTVT
jgi:hypothetical protein